MTLATTDPNRLRLYWREDQPMAPPYPSPSFLVESSSTLGPGAQWEPLVAPVVRSNDQFTVTLDMPLPWSHSFFRLKRQPPVDAQFTILAQTGAHGTLKPRDAIQTTNGQTLQFTATPDANYDVDAWYLDGAVVKTTGTEYSLGDIHDEHTITVAFAPLQDLALTKIADLQTITEDFQQGAFVGSNLTYTIIVANSGINPATGVKVTDVLADTVSFVSVQASQGSCQVAGNSITCAIGALARGDSATINIVVIPQSAGPLTNTARVTGNEEEVDSSNNEQTLTFDVKAQ